MAAVFSESETCRNLMRAFAGESQARNRYTFAASMAKKQSLYVVESVFRFTADQELAHARVFYDFLKPLAGEVICIEGSYPVDQQEGVQHLLRQPRVMSMRSMTRYMQNLPKPLRMRDLWRSPMPFE